MKIAKRYISYYRNLFVLIGFLSFFSVITIKAMNISQIHQNKSRLVALKKKAEAKKEAIKKAIKERVNTLGDKKYFIHAAGTAQGEVISEQALRLSGELASVVDALNTLGGSKEIVLKAHSPESIKILCDVLNDKEEQVEEDIKDFSLEKLVNIANMFSAFDIKAEKKNDKDNEQINKIEDIVLRKIKIEIEDKNGNLDYLRYLSSDLQRSLMADRTADYLRNIIMQAKNMNYPDAFVKHMMSGVCNGVYSLVFSPDGNKIAAGSSRKVILWDINKTTYQVLIDYTDRINGLGCFSALAFSPDGQKIAIGGFDELMLWDISNLEKPKMQLFEDKVGHVQAVRFNHKSNMIAMGGRNKLMLWDISSSEIKKWSQDVKAIATLAFSPDDTKLVSGGKDLILWNIQNFDKIMFEMLFFNDVNAQNRHYFLQNPQDLHYFSQVAFSKDGKKIVVGDFSKLKLWNIDVKDDNKIILDLKGPFVASLIFSGDDKTVFLCHSYTTNAKSLTSWFTDEKWHKIYRVFITFNMSDLTKQTLNIGYNFLSDCIFEQIHNDPVAISSDGNKIVVPDKDQLNLFIFLNDEQKFLINKIKNAESFESLSQMRLLYELCLWSLKKREININRLCELEKMASKLLPLSVRQLFFKDQSKDHPYSYCTLW